MAFVTERKTTLEKLKEMCLKRYDEHNKTSKKSNQAMHAKSNLDHVFT